MKRRNSKDKKSRRRRNTLIAGSILAAGTVGGKIYLDRRKSNSTTPASTAYRQGQRALSGRSLQKPNGSKEYFAPLAKQAKKSAKSADVLNRRKRAFGRLTREQRNALSNSGFDLNRMRPEAKLVTRSTRMRRVRKLKAMGRFSARFMGSLMFA